MSDRLGLVQLAPRENPYLNNLDGFGVGPKPFSDETARVIDEEVLKIITESHDEARRLLVAHRRQLDQLADSLLTHETLDEQQILDVTGLPPAAALEPYNTRASTIAAASRIQPPAPPPPSMRAD